MQHSDPTTHNEEQWRILSQQLEARVPEAQLILIQTDSFASRDQWIEACTSQAPHLQHIGLDLSQEQVESLGQVLESKFADVVGASEETPVQIVAHILHLETSLFQEILNEESHLIPALETEAEELISTIPLVGLLWTDQYMVSRLEKEAPAFLAALAHRLHFLQEEAEEAISDPYETLASLRKDLHSDEAAPVKIDGYLEVGDVFGQYGRYQLAKDWYEKGLETAKAQENKVGQARSFERIGDLLVGDQDLGASLSWYDQALELFTEEEKKDIANIQQKVGALFLRLRNHQKALPRLIEAQERFAELEEFQQLGETYRQIAKALEYKGDPAGTIKAYESSVEAFGQIDGAEKDLALTYQQMGAIHQGRHNWAEALQAFKDALPHANAIEDDFLISALEDSVEAMEEKTKGASPGASKKKGWLGKLFG
ncbi:MAG: tetratricopeptide repeat protein [Bacteroidota bacterium]